MRADDFRCQFSFRSRLKARDHQLLRILLVPILGAGLCGQDPAQTVVVGEIDKQQVTDADIRRMAAAVAGSPQLLEMFRTNQIGSGGGLPYDVSRFRG